MNHRCVIVSSRTDHHLSRQERRPQRLRLLVTAIGIALSAVSCAGGDFGAGGPGDLAPSEWRWLGGSPLRLYFNADET